MPLRRLTRFSKLELDKERAELQATIDELDAILEDDKLLRKVVSDELNDVAKTYGTPRRTVLLESAGQTVTAAVSAGGGRRPVLRLPLQQRPPRAHLRHRHAGGRRGPREARRDRLRGAGHRSRAGRRPHHAGPARQGRRARPADAARDRQPPAPAGRRSRQRVPRAGGGRARARADHPRRGLPRAGARHPPGHRQAGQRRGAREPRRLGGHPARRRRRGRGRGRARARRRGALLRHLGRPAAALRRERGAAPGPVRRWHRRRTPRGQAVGRLLRRVPSRRHDGGGHRLGLGHGTARHRAGRPEGHAVRGVPRQGPRHGRRALPPLPQGRGHPRPRVGGSRSGAGRRLERRRRRPPRGDRSSRRLRRARLAAGGGRVRAGLPPRRGRDRLCA